MPNNVNNYVTITVPKEQKDAFLEFVKKISYGNDITEGISYDKVIPCPKEYHIDQDKKRPHYDSSSTNDMALKDYTTYVLHGRTVPNGNKLADRGYTKQELAETIGKIMYENEQKYGAKDWYDWCYANWSTKWDAYDTETEYTETRENLTYDWQFTSAWNPPYKVLEKLFKTIMVKFPNASIVGSCDGEIDERGEFTVNNVGDITWTWSSNFDDDEYDDEDDEEYDAYED